MFWSYKIEPFWGWMQTACAHLKLNEGLRVVRMVNLIRLFYHRFIFIFIFLKKKGPNFLISLTGLTYELWVAS